MEFVQTKLEVEYACKSQCKCYNVIIISYLITECPVILPFVSNTAVEKIPSVFLPLSGQIIYPSREISLTGKSSLTSTLKQVINKQLYLVD